LLPGGALPAAAGCVLRLQLLALLLSPMHTSANMLAAGSAAAAASSGRTAWPPQLLLPALLLPPPAPA
jgi:hypothetical protein